MCSSLLLFRYNEVGGEAFRACVTENPGLLSDCCGHDGRYSQERVMGPGIDYTDADGNVATIPGVEISVEDIADYAWAGNTAMP